MALQFKLSDAGVFAALLEDLQLPSFLDDVPYQAHLDSFDSHSAFFHHLFHSQYLLSNSYFYLYRHLNVNTTQSINYNYNYYVLITTDQSSYIYTNLYSYYSSQAINIHQTDTQSQLNFQFQWSKPSPSENVKNVQITLFFTYANGQNFGIVIGSLDGYSIAEGSIAGYLNIKQGNGNNMTTQSNLILNSYNVQVTQQQMYQSANYLDYQYSAIPVNLPSDLLRVTMAVNYGCFLSTHSTPSILGQLVWSWVQYFPIFLSLYWLADKSMCLLLRADIIKRKLTHDTEYAKKDSNGNSSGGKVLLF